MSRFDRIALLASPLLALGLAAGGCSTGTGTGSTDADVKADMAGGLKPGEYPAGPFGTSPGSVIANLTMSGRRDDNKNGSITEDAERPIKLGDYVGADTKILAVIVGAEWCAPCQAEQPELVALWKDYKTANKGVAFLEIVAQNSNSSTGDLATLDRWAGKFKIPFDMAADPQSVLGPYYNLNSFPMQMVVRTSDMTIQGLSNGPPMGWLKSQIDPLVQ